MVMLRGPSPALLAPLPALALARAIRLPRSAPNPEPAALWAPHRETRTAPWPPLRPVETASRLRRRG
eukprot:8146550-Lingulodinium_polyedra.AAC.1